MYTHVHSWATSPVTDGNPRPEAFCTTQNKAEKCVTELIFTCEDESAHTRDEARQKAIEGEGADEQTVEELQRACQQDVQQICVHHLELVGRRGGVLLQKPRNDRND